MMQARKQSFPHCLQCKNQESTLSISKSKSDNSAGPSVGISSEKTIQLLQHTHTHARTRRHTHTHTSIECWYIDTQCILQSKLQKV